MISNLLNPVGEDTAHIEPVAGPTVPEGLPFTMKPETGMHLSPSYLRMLVQATKTAKALNMATFMFLDAAGTEYEIGTDYAGHVCDHYTKLFDNE